MANAVGIAGMSRVRRQPEPSLENPCHRRDFERKPGQPFDLAPRRYSIVVGRIRARLGLLSAMTSVRPPRRRRILSTRSRREVERPVHRTSGSDTPRFEAVARITVDAELAAGQRYVERIPERRFDQHIRRRRQSQLRKCSLPP